MVVRSLDPADHSAVLALNNDAVPAVGALDATQLEHLVEQSSLALAVGGDDGRDDGPLAGFCLVLPPGADYGSVNYRWFAERYDDFAYLDRVVIAPASRGHGLGRELYRHVEQATDAAWFCLEVNLRPRNDASLAFHQALGFEQVGEQETDYGALVSMQAKRLR
jgi:uncharacterized protein